MKVAIILNGISNKKKFFYRSILPAIEQAFQVSVLETENSTHAYALAEEAARSHQFVLAAGGDGTLHQCVNGVLRATGTGRESPAVGVIPLGTGNDFARLCGIQPNAQQIINLIQRNRPKATDLGLITCADQNSKPVNRYFINVCSLGMGPEVVRRLMGDNRRLGPTITYLKAIVGTFFSHKPQEVMVASDHWRWEGRARVLAVANGRTFGNGLCVAPDAKVDDGSFCTFIAGDLPLFRFLLYLQKIKKCEKIKDTQIAYNVATSLEVTAPLETAIEAEGELVGHLPARIEMKPASVAFLR